MTWGSFFTRSTALFLVLPLALQQFVPSEMTLWNILLQVTGLQLIIDLGFTPTFTRLIAFARGGATSLAHLGSQHQAPAAQPNWGLVVSIYRVMKVVYLRLGLVYFGVLATVGTYYVHEAATGLAHPAQGWSAWATILIVSFFSLRANQTKAVIEGLNYVALLRRWEILTSLCGVLTTFAVFYFEGNIFQLILASQIWVVINIWRNYQILHSLPESGGLFGPTAKQVAFDPNIFRQVWSAAWRTGVGVLLTSGTLKLLVLQTTKEIQVVSVLEAAVFSTALRIMDSILDFSVAPLYSKLPRLASLYAKGDMGVFMGIARQSMLRSYWALVIPVILAGVAGPAALAVLESNIAFPDLQFWLLLGIAQFLQRFGASHLQLYSISNTIVWHIAGAGSAIVMLAVWGISLPHFGIYAYPLAGIATALLFYAWYCANKSYRFFGLHFWTFEPTVSFLPFISLLTSTGLVYGGINVQIAPKWAIEIWTMLRDGLCHLLCN